VRGDIKAIGDACDGMATINNLFGRFNFELFGIRFTAHGHLRVILNDLAVSVKPVAIHFSAGHLAISELASHEAQPLKALYKERSM
jgi:hypothetical protein